MKNVITIIPHDIQSFDSIKCQPEYNELYELFGLFVTEYKCLI